MTGPDRDRLALITVTTAEGTSRRGTGYLVEPGVVLTAKHVMIGKPGDASMATAVVWLLSPEPERREQAVSKVECGSATVDVAILELKGACQTHCRREVQLGWFDRSYAVDAVTCGFPHFELMPGNSSYVSETTEARGRLLPSAGSVLGNYEMEVTANPLSNKQWEGMSGAPVFAEGRFVGMVQCAAANGSRLHVLPLRKLLDANPRLMSSTHIAEVVPGGGLSPRLVPAPEGAVNPGTLLLARHCVVPFHERIRDREIARLDAWCNSAKHVSLGLLVGPGGAGKTRLLIEYCRARRRAGWRVLAPAIRR